MTAASSDRRTAWPPWSADAAPADLARYVVPHAIRMHTQLPGPSDAPALRRVRAVWDRLREAGIGYALEPPDSGPCGQWIRPPAEVLRAPRNGTCLDLAVLLAGAFRHTGLLTAVVLLDPVEPGRPGHALVVVALTRTWPEGLPGDGVWPTLPQELLDHVQAGLDGPPRSLLILNPNGISQPLGAAGSKTDTDLATAVATGYAQLTSGTYRWRVAVPADPDVEPYTPAAFPAVLPLRDPYREPGTAESALRLLRAEYQVTPFQSRDEMTVLSGLCEEAVLGSRTTIAVITGRGGSGKTRLGLELVDRMARAGWYAGVLRERAGADRPWDWLAEVTAPLLVLVDYADARAGSTIELLRVVARRPRPAVVVLTAREREGEWLTRITDALESDAHPHRLENIELPDAHPRPEDLFLRTCAAVRPRLCDSPPRLPRADKGTRWTTLDLVLLGWLAARGTDPLPITPAELYDEVLRHERRYWNTTFEHRTGSPLRYTGLLAEAAACLTLLAPAPHRVAEALTAVSALAGAHDLRQQIAHTLVTCLDPGAGEHVAIRPDPVGDHHLLTTLERRPELLERCLRAGSLLDEDDLGEGLRNALTVLTRAGRDDEPAAVAHIEALLRSEPGRWPLAAAVAAAMGGVVRNVLEALAAASDTPLPLDDISAALPFGAASLWKLALIVDERRLAGVRAGDGEPEELGELLFLVSRRRDDAGDRAGALAAIEEAVPLYSDLALADPEGHLPNLAAAWNDLATHRGATGDRYGAVDAAEGAVRLQRKLVDELGREHQEALARSLNTLATCRAATDDRAGALSAAEEAVRIYRDLAHGVPSAHLRDAYVSDLAASLNNLAHCRASMGDRQGALAAGEEGVELRRRLLSGQTDDTLADLAHALNNVSGHRSNIGDDSAALAAAVEATSLYRQLLDMNQAYFAPELAGSLNNLSVSRSRTGDFEAALADAEEATALYRALASDEDGAFAADLAMSLNTLGNRRAETGDREGSVAAAAEAVDLYRTLFDEDQDVFALDLAASLGNLSAGRAAAGDVRGALDAAEEAARLCRYASDTKGGAFAAEVARALNTLSLRRSDAGDQTGALAVAREAVTVRRQLASAEPGAFTRELAISLNNLSHRLWLVGDRREAARAGEEALALYRRLASANRTAVLPDLAAAVNNLSVLADDVGDRERALALGQEAIGLFGELAAINGAAWNPGLAGALNNQSVKLTESGDFDAASEAAEASAALYRELAAADRAAFLPDLAMAVNNLSRCRYESDNIPAAISSAQEAVSLYRECVAQKGAAFTADLARALNNLSAVLSDTADHVAALDSAEEAVRLYRATMGAHPTALVVDLSKALNNIASARLALRDPRGALTAVGEAAELLRALVRTEPAYMFDLARTLNALASALYATRDFDGALAAGREGVELLRILAGDDPASYAPELALATWNLADLLMIRSPAEAAAAWDASAQAVPEGHGQAEVLAGTADWRTSQGDQRTAAEVLRRAAELAHGDDARAPGYLTRRVREQIRAVALSLDPPPSTLPGWAVETVPEADLDLLRSWRTTRDWPDAEAVLTARADVVSGPTVAASVDLHLVLRPDDESLGRLRQLVVSIQDRGLEAVLAEQRRRYAVQALVDAWITQPTRARWLAHLATHREELCTGEAAEILAASAEPSAREHAAVLALLETMPLETVSDVVTHAATAADLALEALEQADPRRMRTLTEANPAALDEPGVGFVLRAVLDLERGDAEQAERVLRAGAATATAMQRRARAVNLARWARHADSDDLAAIEALIAALGHAADQK
ncbi:tetratricopeptide repeat protein [Streptomyces sp. NPDC101116]|uniref:tetratricopeptide repeat protein n=1 Tax=Streptomyces sp. NPDC101116 TaxID=3366107 RepID=UPI00382F00D5